MSEVLVFKTNAYSELNFNGLNQLLRQTKGVHSWNFDFEDCDNIFRLVGNGVSSRQVLDILAEAGIAASELEDAVLPAEQAKRSPALKLVASAAGPFSRPGKSPQ